MGCRNGGANEKGVPSQAKEKNISRCLEREKGIAGDQIGLSETRGHFFVDQFKGSCIDSDETDYIQAADPSYLPLGLECKELLY